MEKIRVDVHDMNEQGSVLVGKDLNRNKERGLEKKSRQRINHSYEFIKKTYSDSLFLHVVMFYRYTSNIQNKERSKKPAKFHL